MSGLRQPLKSWPRAGPQEQVCVRGERGDQELPTPGLGGMEGVEDSARSLKSSLKPTHLAVGRICLETKGPLALYSIRNNSDRGEHAPDQLGDHRTAVRRLALLAALETRWSRRWRRNASGKQQARIRASYPPSWAGGLGGALPERECHHGGHRQDLGEQPTHMWGWAREQGTDDRTGHAIR